MAQTKAQLVVGLNVNASAPASALQIDASGNVNLDSNTLYVDATNNRVGIGTSSPGSKFHVIGGTTSGSVDTAAIFTGGVINTVGSGARIYLSGTPGFETTRGTYIEGVFDTATNAHSLRFATNSSSADPVERMRITSAGNVGIGTTSPVSALNVSVADGGKVTISNTNDGHTGGLAFGDTSSNTSGQISYDHFTNAMRFDTAGSERARIDSSGRLLVGTSTTTTDATVLINKNRVPGGTGPHLVLGGFDATSWSNDEEIGAIDFWNNDSGTNGIAAQVRAIRSSTAGEGGQLLFHTANSGGAALTERMRIASDGSIRCVQNGGNFFINTTSTLSNHKVCIAGDSQTVMYLDRNGNDGNLLTFFRSGSEVGVISVASGTVSYGGGHISRWSQLPSNAERTEILMGSVLSNLDEMCEWAYDAEPEVLWAEGEELPEGVQVGDVKTPARPAGTEENIQLNRMKVSDVEGDPNVAGVFQNWDDEDETYTNDFFCAMTGDFIIRIAAGVTVERGDLLMSAGDGTAKPQDDDIIRSKTIAKVTSTNVSCTYDDGSYCVPCVLMAC